MFMPVSELVLDMVMAMGMDGVTLGMVTVMVMVILGMDMVGVIPVMVGDGVIPDMVGVITLLTTQAMDMAIPLMVRGMQIIHVG